MFLDKNEREEGISFCVGKLRLSRFVNDQISIEDFKELLEYFDFISYDQIILQNAVTKKKIT